VLRWSHAPFYELPHQFVGGGRPILENIPDFVAIALERRLLSHAA